MRQCKFSCDGFASGPTKHNHAEIFRKGQNQIDVLLWSLWVHTVVWSSSSPAGFSNCLLHWQTLSCFHLLPTENDFTYKAVMNDLVNEGDDDDSEEGF